MVAEVQLNSRLLSLPYDIRHRVYELYFAEPLVVVPYPLRARWPRARPRAAFKFPPSDSLLVRGIDNIYNVFGVCESPYDRRGIGLQSTIGVDMPDPLMLTCRQVHDESRTFIMSRNTYAFSDFRSLIMFVKRTPEHLLLRVRSLLVAMHLRMSYDGDLVEDDEPWFDAWKLASRRLLGVCYLSVQAELYGEEQNYDIARHYQDGLPPEKLRPGFDALALRVANVTKTFAQLQERSIAIRVVIPMSKWSPWAATGGASSWQYTGAECRLSDDAIEQIKKLESFLA